MRIVLIGSLICSLACATVAAETPAPVVGNVRQAAALARFTSLHAPAAAALADRFALVGLGVTQEAGQATLAVQQIQVTRGGQSTLIDKIQATTPLALDAAYMNNPIGGLLQALLVKGEVRIDRIESSGARVRRDQDFQGVKDVLIKITAGNFEGMVSMGLIRAKATGTLAYDPATRKVVVTVTSVSAGVPIGLDKVFEQLAAVFIYDWTVVAKPKVTVLFDEMFR